MKSMYAKSLVITALLSPLAHAAMSDKMTDRAIFPESVLQVAYVSVDVVIKPAANKLTQSQRETAQQSNHEKIIRELISAPSQGRLSQL